MGHFMLDNASNNDTAMQTLSQVLLDEREFMFDPDERWIRCFPHIMHICVHHTIDKYTDADFTDVAAQWFNALKQPVNKTTYLRVMHWHDLLLEGRCACILGGEISLTACCIH